MPIPRTTAILTVVGQLLGCAGSLSLPDDLPVTPAQRAAVRALLKAHPGERLAGLKDTTNPYLTDYRAEHAGYHPYFCTDDITQDGTPDLLLATVAKGVVPPRFSLFFFPSSPAGLGLPVFLGHPNPFDDSGIIPTDAGIVFGPFYSDAGFVYRWNPMTERLENVTDSLAPEE